MSATAAIAALESAKIPHEVHRYDHDPRTTSFGDEAVDAMCGALGVDPDQILKTLVVEADGALAVAVLPVSSQLSLKKIAKALGRSKAAMADTKKVTRSTGYVLGGVSPLGQKNPLPTVVDESATGWPSVLFSGGRRGLEIQVDPAELVRLTDATVADIRA